MKIQKIVIALLGTFLISGVMAGTMGPVVPEWTKVATLSVGPAWQSAGRTQTFFLTPEIEKTYTNNKHKRTLVSGELFLGWRHLLGNGFTGEGGLAFMAAANARLSGEIWDDADPVFNNFIYSYRINHTHVALKGKLLATQGYFLTPYISGSIGVGFNRASNFSNTPTIFEALPNPDFASKTKTALSYTLGIGVQHAISEQWHAGIGYEFANWGKTELGRAVGQTLGTGPTLNHLYTNGLMFSLSYLS